MAPKLSPKKPSDMPAILPRMREIILERLLEDETLLDLAEEIEYGEIEIVIHDKTIRDVHLTLRLRTRLTAK